jgi:murein DD-endopeptidase MepM/ murein hydrolase activator NlpD
MRSRTRTFLMLCLALAVLPAAVLAAPLPAASDSQAPGAPTPRFFALDKVAAPASAGRVVYPVRGKVSYGEGGAKYGAARPGRVHEGQDLLADAGTPLVAMRDGVVLETGDDGGRGNYLAFYSPAVKRTFVYLHMQRPARVKHGDHLRAGQRVGRVGCTGSCFGDHLHLEIRRGRSLQGKAQNPLPLLRRLRR